MKAQPENSKARLKNENSGTPPSPFTMLRIRARTGPLEGASGMCMVYSPMFMLRGFSLRTGRYSRRSFSVMIPPGTSTSGQMGPLLKFRWLLKDVSKTCCLDVLHNALSHGPPVEGVRTLLGDPLVRVGQLRESDDVVFLQDISLGVAEHRAGRRKDTRQR